MRLSARPTPAAAVEACSNDKMTEIRARASADAPSVDLDCQPTFQPGETITKRLDITGDKINGAVIDCRQSRLGTPEASDGSPRIRISSLSVSETEWRVPENITFRDCMLYGGIHVLGIYPHGPNSPVFQSSRCEVEPYKSIDPECRHHTRRAQPASPRNITFDKMIIYGTKGPVVYFWPGVNSMTLVNSTITGTGYDRAMYIDAESGYNVVRNNIIDGRISLDGSAFNTVVGNDFSDLSRGGVDMYRNCGELGVVRHQAPQYNVVMNNVFFYDRYRGDNPSVFVAARNGPDCDCLFGVWPCWGRCYCDEDEKFDFGSGASNRDFARYNIVADNRIVKRRVDEMIKVDEEANLFVNNVTVQRDVRGDSRPSSCYDFSMLPTAYIRHGETRALTTARGAPGCRGTMRCNDGRMELESPRCPSASDYHLQDFDCTRSGTNEGARCTASCPVRQKIFAAKAVCNLETTGVSTGEVDRLGWGTMVVNRASDDRAAGKCRFGRTEISEHGAFIDLPANARSVMVSCQEHDKNGGDCTIRGRLVCTGPREASEPGVTPPPPAPPPPPTPPTRADCLAACDRDRDACMKDPATRAPVCIALRTACRSACPAE